MVCLPKAPRVVETLVESPRNIVDDPLHNLLVLRVGTCSLLQGDPTVGVVT
jgi:hypothetical protein